MFNYRDNLVVLLYTHIGCSASISKKASSCFDNATWKHFIYNKRKIKFQQARVALQLETAFVFVCVCVCVVLRWEREREKRYKNNNNDDEKLSAHSIDLTRMEVQGAHSERRRDTVEGDIFSSYSRYPSDPTSLGDLGYLASVTLPPGRKAVKS